MPFVYLASGSPRRCEILMQLGYYVEKVVAQIDETPYLHESSEQYVCRMAREKNHAARTLYESTLDKAIPLISADTTVSLHGKILGKPESETEAFEILSMLSGAVHQVLTAVCLSYRGKEKTVLQCSHVHFKDLTQQEIQNYIVSGEPMDKAGAYGIQGIGGALVRHLSGSFTGVMGLPVFETVELLRDYEYDVPPFVS